MPRFASLLLALLAGFIAAPRAAECVGEAEGEAVEAGTNLPVVLIDAKEPIVSERKVPCLAQIVLPPGAAEQPEALTGVVRIRGATSQRYDATFGRNWDASRLGVDMWLSNFLFERLHGDAAFRKRFAARWRQLREKEFSLDTLHRSMDDNAQTLGDAARRNAARWRTLSGPYPDRLTFEQDLAQMKEWVAARVKWLDAEIARRAD